MPDSDTVPITPPAPLGFKSKEQDVAERNVIPAEKIHAAMLKCDGDRKLAAESLGLTTVDLRGRIFRHNWLKIEWSVAATRAKREVKKAVIAGLEPETAIDIIIRQQAETEQLEIIQIQQQLRKLEDRIENADKAREMWCSVMRDDEQEFYNKYAFSKDSKGGPAEEEMVREAYVNLQEELRLKKAQALDSIHVKAKIQALLKQGKGSGRGVPGKTSFKSKSSMIEEGAGKSTVHVHAGRGSQVLVAQPNQPKIPNGTSH